MKYGEDIIKLFQEHYDKKIHLKNEYRVAIVKDNVVLGVYSSYKEASEEAGKTLERLTYVLYMFYPLITKRPNFNELRFNSVIPKGYTK